MGAHLLRAECPLFSRALIGPWRLVSLGFGLVLLVAGSFCLPSADWDVSICFVMGLPAYVLASWAFRQMYYFRWKWWPLAALAFWLSVDGTYWLYWGVRDPALAHVFRPANFFYCTPIFWIAGVVWNLDLRGMRLLVSRPLDEIGEALERKTMLGARFVAVAFSVIAISTAVGVASGLVKVELVHEQLFFEDGSNIGWGDDEKQPGNGAYIKNEAEGRYSKRDGGYDDCVMRNAVSKVDPTHYQLSWAGPKTKCNCQDYADALRREYRTLIPDPKVRCECNVK